MSYRISLLSTDRDLKDTRHELAAYLKNLGFHVIAFESDDFPVRPGLHSHDVCLKNLEEADVVVLLIDSRYGGMYKDTQKSITEVEWERSRELGIAILPCIRQEANDRSFERWTEYKNTGNEDPGEYFESFKVVEFIRKVRKADTDNYCIFFPDPPQLKTSLRSKLASLAPHFLKEFSAIQLDTIGNWRTAAPTDLSLSEYFQQDLFIDPPLHRRGTPDEAEIHERKTTLTDISADTPSLILGMPGMGKTTLLYGLFRNLVHTPVDNEITTLFLPLSELPDPFANTADAIKLIMERYGNRIYPLLEDISQKILFLIDGLDEVIALNPRRAEELLQSDIFDVEHIASCRSFEFDTYLANPKVTSRYSRIYELSPWQKETEIEEYLLRMAKQGFPPEVLDVARNALNDQEVLEVTRTPLLLRMLVFIITEGGESSGLTIAVLYKRFFDLWITRENSRDGSFKHYRKETYRAWLQVAWNGYINYGVEAFPAEDISVWLRKMRLGKLIEDERFWIIFNRFNGLAKFIHQSYQEFLTADAVAGRITSGDNLGEMLGIHLIREVRHFLIDILHSGQHEDVVTAQIKNWFMISDQGVLSLTAQNQALYILGHLTNQGSMQLLVDLLESDLPIFVRSSLYWALIRRGDTEAEERYLKELVASEEDPSGYDALNRGYHLFYYGEWPSQDEPPYEDTAADAWDRTRIALTRNIQLKNPLEYHQYLLNVYTLLRFIETRGDTISVDLSSTIQDGIQTIQNNRSTESETIHQIARRFREYQDT